MLQEPDFVLFLECPNCNRLLHFGVEACPHCREEIDLEYAMMSAAAVYYNTAACSLANWISTFNSFIPLALIGTVVLFLIDMFGSGTRLSLGILVWSFVPLSTTVVWYWRYGRFVVGNEEYFRAKREVRRSFAFWLVLFIVQALLIAFAWFRT